MLQGLSVLAMLCLHLFDRLDYEGLFHPLLFMKGLPMCFYFGQISDFCVFGFAFCSGYAHMKLFESDAHYYPKRLKSLLRLLLHYWIIVAFFSILSIAFGQTSRMPGSFMTVLGNLFLYRTTYCGAWWYLYAYAFIVLISPFTLRLIQKAHLVVIAVFGLALYCGAYYLRFHFSFDDLILSKSGPIGMTLAEYLIGAVFYREKLFSYIFSFYEKMRAAVRVIIAIAIVLLLFFARTLLLPSLFFAPISGMIIIILFHFWEKPEAIIRCFRLLGEHSTNIWLVHMFFYLYIFDNLVYRAIYPPFILVFMLCLTLFTSMLLRPVQNAVAKLVGG